MQTVLKWKKRWLLPRRREEFRQRDFCIVSNNCWGAHVYSELGKPYLTPFIGLFLKPDCYLSLLENFHSTVRQPLLFTGKSRYESVNRQRSQSNHYYPIAELAPGLEVHFLHYASQDEARSKWERRVARIPPPTETHKFFFKLCDHDGLSPAQLNRFWSLPFAHKVCFSASRSLDNRRVIYIPDGIENRVPNGLGLSHISYKYFDALDWLRGGMGRPNWASIL